MQYHQIPLKELTSTAAVLRVAAEVVHGDMLYERDPSYRIGCCAAFNRIRDAADTAYHNDRISLSKREGIVKRVYAAKELFANTYRDDSRSHSAYWMGPRTPVGQKRRMSALLSLADSL